MVIGNFWIKSPIFNPPITFLCRHACQYLIPQSVFCTISPKFTLANNSPYMAMKYTINIIRNTAYCSI